MRASHFALFDSFVQLNMFVNRLNGEPIGVSVLGVINKNTILTVRYTLHIELNYRTRKPCYRRENRATT